MLQSFGEFLRQKRIEQNYTINSFCRAAGLSAAYVSYIETGKRPAPSDKILDKIAVVLGLNANDCERLYFLASLTHKMEFVPENIPLLSYVLDNPGCQDVIYYAKNHCFSNDDWSEILRQLSRIVRK